MEEQESQPQPQKQVQTQPVSPTKALIETIGQSIRERMFNQADKEFDPLKFAMSMYWLSKAEREDAESAYWRLKSLKREETSENPQTNPALTELKSELTTLKEQIKILAEKLSEKEEEEKTKRIIYEATAPLIQRIEQLEKENEALKEQLKPKEKEPKIPPEVQETLTQIRGALERLPANQRKDFLTEVVDEALQGVKNEVKEKIKDAIAESVFGKPEIKTTSEGKIAWDEEVATFLRRQGPKIIDLIKTWLTKTPPKETPQQIIVEPTPETVAEPAPEAPPTETQQTPAETVQETAQPQPETPPTTSEEAKPTETPEIKVDVSTGESVESK